MWCLVVLNAHAQQKLSLLKEEPVNAHLVQYDVLGNRYTLEPKVLTKWDRVQNMHYAFSLLSNGIPSQIDCSNPMHVMLFYKDNQTLTWLDNTLSLNQNAVSLAEFGYLQVEAVGNSARPGYWLFDKSSDQLIFINREFQTELESGNLFQLTGSELNPSKILERNAKVYVLDYDYGIYVFDQNAVFLKRIPMEGVSQVEVDDAFLLLGVGNTLLSYHTIDLEIDTLKVFEDSIRTISMTKNTLSIMLVNRVLYYSGE